MTLAAPGLRFFLDSADPSAWEPLLASGWVYGVTTNPLILQQHGLPTNLATARELVAAATHGQLAELQFQTWGETASAFVRHGEELVALSALITVKVPATPAGFQAAAQLKNQGIRVTLTACYTVAQCAVAQALQLDYVAPYYGRMLEASIDADARLDGMQLVAVPGGQLRVLIASLRSVAQVEALLSRGFDTFTLRPALAAQLMHDAISDQAATDFEAAAGP